MQELKNFLYVLLGVGIAIAGLSIAICIGSAVNGLSFGQQITEWFGSIGKATVETIETVKK